MEHRKMGALDACPALLGFGCMRFPLTPEGKIDEPEAARMIGRALSLIHISSKDHLLRA